MPTAQKTVALRSKLEKVWKFLSDVENIGEALGVVEQTTLEEGKSRWSLKSPFSIVTQTKTLDVVLTKAEEEKKVSWKAEGDHLTIEGKCSFESRNDETICDIVLTFEPKGALSPILKPMMEMNIGSRLQVFVNSLKERLES